MQKRKFSKKSIKQNLTWYSFIIVTLVALVVLVYRPTVSTVPAPISISGCSLHIRRMASSAAAVRNVTSAHESPPSTNASASSFAFFASSRTTTGIIPYSMICLSIFSINVPDFPYKCMPPSTIRSIPVMYFPSSAHSSRAAAAQSSALPA